MTESVRHESGFLIQGTVVDDSSMTLKLYSFKDMVVGGAPGELYSAAPARLLISDRIFPWSLRRQTKANADELSDQTTTGQATIFSRIALNLGELEEALRQLYIQQGYPVQSANSLLSLLMRLINQT